MKSGLMLYAVLLSLVSSIMAEETPTPDNSKIGEETLATSARAMPQQVEVQLYFIEYKMEDVEKLAREDKLETEPLLTLWKKGDAELLHAPRALVQAGFKSTVKSVTEVLYPSDVDVIVATIGSSTTNSVAFVEPQNFIMREVGTIMEWVPEVTPDGNTISITVAPQIVSPPTWKKYGGSLTDSIGAEKAASEQPFFHVQSFATSFSVSNGATVMVGGGMDNEAGDKTIFAFVRARLVDTEGKPLVLK